MRIRKRAIALPVLLSAVVIAAGCGNSSTNEPAFDAGPPPAPGSVKTYKGYGDAIKEGEAKIREETKAKKAGTPKETAPAKPAKAQEAQPKP
jgi:hypothetical protein